MKIQLYSLLKSIQILLISVILWRVFSELQICGRFVRTKDVLRHGIEGTCPQLFFYLPPNPNENLTASLRLPRLRLWWSYDAQQFLPPKPGKQELGEMAEKIKEKIVESAKMVEEKIRVAREMDTGEEGENEGEEEMKSEFSLVKKTAMLPEEEEQPEELLELDKYSREAERNGTEAKMGMPKRRQKREMDELPWEKMKKNAKLPHEEIRPKYLGKEHKKWEMVEIILMGKYSSSESNLDENSFFCFELNMRELGMDPENRGWASPLVTLGTRSVATIAVGFSHLLLLFAQVYLLNCLEVDNLEQKRGKLFLELLIILVSFLGWLVIVLVKIRTELHWEMIWMCTNFRPEIFKMIVFVQVFASTLMLFALFEGLYIFAKMRKCSKQIEIERENDLKPQRPSI